MSFFIAFSSLLAEMQLMAGDHAAILGCEAKLKEKKEKKGRKKEREDLKAYHPSF